MALNSSKSIPTGCAIFLCPRIPSSAFRNQFWTYCTKFSPPVHRQFLHVARCFYGAPVRAPEFSRIGKAGFACNLHAVAQSTIYTASVETPYSLCPKKMTPLDTSIRKKSGILLKRHIILVELNESH
jgi:hypothetical protein